MRTLKYFLEDDVKYKASVHQLDFFVTFLQKKVKNRVILKLDIRYADYFQNIQIIFGRDLGLLKSMYVMTNSGKLSADDFTEWLF